MRKQTNTHTCNITYNIHNNYTFAQAQHLRIRNTHKIHIQHNNII